MWGNYPGTKFIGKVLKSRKRMKTSPSCVHVLHKTLNLRSFHVVLLKRMEKKLPIHQARVERLVLLIRPLVLWRSRCRRRHLIRYAVSTQVSKRKVIWYTWNCRLLYWSGNDNWPNKKLIIHVLLFASIIWFSFFPFHLFSIVVLMITKNYI